MAGCDQRGPLTRAGQAQPDRDLAELRPTHFQLDERDVADLCLLAERFAAHIRYYDPGNVAAGDWTRFFDSDLTAILARLAKLPVESYRNALIDAERFLKAEESRPPAELAAHFKLVFHLPFALFERMAAGHGRLSPEHSLFRLIQRLVRRDLEAPFGDLVGYYKGAIGLAAPIFDDTPLDPADYKLAPGGPPTDDRPRLSGTVQEGLFERPELSLLDIPPRAISEIAPTGWADFFTNQNADDGPYLDAIGGPNETYEQVFDALTYNLLVQAIEDVFAGLDRIRQEAATALRQSMEAFAAHTPHYGLWLAFLGMFDVARGELNRLTARHLDFYFQETLRLARRKPTPDKAHLVFELAKGKDAVLLPAGTAFRGGKDGLGLPVSYALQNDIVVNRGTVAELRALRLERTETAGKAYEAFYAAPAAASRDGLGQDLDPALPAWPAAGPIPYGPTDDRTGAPAAPLARFGFAISDRQLFLREGAREITLAAVLATSVGAVFSVPLKARLTAEEGWLEVQGAGRLTATAGGQTLVVRLNLDGDDPAIVPYDAEIHDPGYDTAAPVLELLVDFQAGADAAAAAFARLRNIAFTDLRLESAATGLRRLTVQTQDGTADPAKPFPAFGAQPEKGASLVIGSSEIFSRPLASLTLRVGWEQQFSNSGYFIDPTAIVIELSPGGLLIGGPILTPFGVGGPPTHQFSAGVSFLSQGAWKPSAGASLGLKLDQTSPSLALSGLASADATADQTLEDAPYSTRARAGYVRLSLNEGFGHGTFLNEKTRALIGLASPDVTYTKSGGVNLDAGGVPKDPYTPVLTEIVADYVSATAAPAKFLHLHPFGAAEASSAAGRLFGEIPFRGALLVGVADLEPPARLTLLVQIADGSGDPLLETPELAFHYLEGDAWRPFVEADVDDKTDNLATSGVLGLAVPEAADLDHAVLPAGLRWFRISAAANVDALNRILAVSAQAATVVFKDQGNDPAFLETARPPGTIAKLETPNPAIKKIAQPFASFGGRGREDLASFRRRASERLRHKDRASTMWDYERLVLEAFPALYRVKCLNHTELVREGGRIVADDEMRPGSVVVVTVPHTHDKPHLDPLRPYADQATLRAVHKLLAARMSPFVRLEVQNPKFEEAHVKFDVAFNEDIADIAFYEAELQRELIDYLTPWRNPPKGQARDIAFGGRLWKSAIINFIEERSYVRYLENVELYHKPDPTLPDGEWSRVDQEAIEASTARSILVSARVHEINQAS